MKEIKGVVASEGIAIGSARVIKPIDYSSYFKKILREESEREERLLLSAISISIEQLRVIYEKSLSTLGEEKAAIFEGHMMLLEDECLADEIIGQIREMSCNAAWAVNTIIERQCEELRAIDDEYLKERAFDVRDIGNRLIKNIVGLPENHFQLTEPVILVIEDITPSEIAQINLEYVKAIVTVIGGKTSHSAIIARSYGIASLCGMKEAFELIEEGQEIIVDAVKGKMILSPSCECSANYQEEILKREAWKQKLIELKGRACETKDGHRVLLEGNIGLVSDVENVIKNDGEGIGLFRTEFLYMDRSNFPSEEEQFQAYKAVAVAMGNKPVIIRTLDIGGDKALSYFTIPKEENPFLGWRAIRIGLEKVEILVTQLRALLRASAFGKIKIMFPMVIDKSEILQLKEHLACEKAKLKEEGIPFDEAIEVGIMIETPAAAIMAHSFCRYIDFFSIGTNDLTQYTLAVDRGNEKIEKLYDSFHPAVLKCMEMSIREGSRHHIETGVCGEFAGDIRGALLLLGMGLDNFSMAPSNILKVKNMILQVNYLEAKQLVDQVLLCEESHEVVTLIDEFFQNNRVSL